MTQKADEVYRAGLDLDDEERTLVAHRLLASVESDGESQPELDAAWRDEIGTRVDDILSGKVELVPFEESRAKARALLKELRR